LPDSDPLRFYVNVQFSPGAALDPFIFAEENHLLPVGRKLLLARLTSFRFRGQVSRPVPVNGRIPLETFKHMFDHVHKTAAGAVESKSS
jgi:hypothetical protein